jgi:hypothetical protein
VRPFPTLFRAQCRQLFSTILLCRHLRLQYGHANRASTPPSFCSLNVSAAIPSLVGFRLFLPGTFSIFGNEVGLLIYCTTAGSKQTFSCHELFNSNTHRNLNPLVYIRHVHRYEMSRTLQESAPRLTMLGKYVKHNRTGHGSH